MMAAQDTPPNEEGGPGLGLTAPSFQEVFATRLLGLPEFERTAVSPESVAGTVSPELGKTATAERPV
jgi:hypothetical protein